MPAVFVVFLFSFKGLRAGASKGASRSEQKRKGGGLGRIFPLLTPGKPLPTCRALRKARKEAFSFLLLCETQLFYFVGSGIVWNTQPYGGHTARRSSVLLMNSSDFLKKLCASAGKRSSADTWHHLSNRKEVDVYGKAVKRVAAKQWQAAGNSFEKWIQVVRRRRNHETATFDACGEVQQRRPNHYCGSLYGAVLTWGCDVDLWTK